MFVEAGIFSEAEVGTCFTTLVLPSRTSSQDLLLE